MARWLQAHSAMQTVIILSIILETAQVTTRQGRVTMPSPPVQIAPAAGREGRGAAAQKPSATAEGLMASRRTGDSQRVQQQATSVQRVAGAPQVVEHTQTTAASRSSRRRSTRVSSLADAPRDNEGASSMASNLRQSQTSAPLNGANGNPQVRNSKLVASRAASIQSEELEDPIMSKSGSVLITPPSPFKSDTQHDKPAFTLIAPPAPISMGQQGSTAGRRKPVAAGGSNLRNMEKASASITRSAPSGERNGGGESQTAGRPEAAERTGRQRSYVPPRARAYKQPDKVPQRGRDGGKSENAYLDARIGMGRGELGAGDSEERLEDAADTTAVFGGREVARRESIRRESNGLDGSAVVRTGRRGEGGREPEGSIAGGGQEIVEAGKESGRYNLRSRTKVVVEQGSGGAGREEGMGEEERQCRKSESERGFRTQLEGKSGRIVSEEVENRRREGEEESKERAGRQCEPQARAKGWENESERSLPGRRPDYGATGRERTLEDAPRHERRQEWRPSCREEAREGARRGAEGRLQTEGRAAVKERAGSPSNANDRIQVCVRKRPLSSKEQREGQLDVVRTATGGTHALSVLEYKRKLDLTEYVEQSDFAFDEVLCEESGNEQVYQRTTQDLVSYVLSHSGKAAVFAYGQTGAGKTYTMMGGRGVPGLYLLACRDIFSMLQEEGLEEVGVCVSFFEIYAGKLFDLLNNRQPLVKREDGRNNVCIRGLTEHAVGSAEELMRAIEWGHESRSTASTCANLDSSRSHAILQIGMREGTRRVERGKLTFIDLAGSERSSDTGKNSDRTRRLEAAEINKSLLALKECIRALAANHSHIPFRGSLLTSVLKDSFIGDCRTVMIANVAPNDKSSEHTLNTLRYADRVKTIKLDAKSELALSRHSLPPRLPSQPPSRDRSRRSSSSSDDSAAGLMPAAGPGSRSSVTRGSARTGRGSGTNGRGGREGEEEVMAEKVVEMHRRHIQETSQLLQKEREILAQVQRKGPHSSSYLSGLVRLMEHKSGLVERMLAMLPFGANTAA